MKLPAAFVLMMSTLAFDARADDPISADREIDAGHRVVSVGAALVPGVVLHGSGHFALGRRTTAYRLLAIEGTGLGLLALGVIPIALSGASRYLVRTSGIIAAMGTGLLGTSLQADFWGVAMPLAARGHPPLSAPIVEADLGYRYVYDPQFRYAHFAVAALDLRWHGLHLSPSIWTAADDINVRSRFLAGYRFFGPRPGTQPARDGSYLELDAAITRHRYGTERFTTVTGEVFTGGRLDLQRIDPWLRGSFSELALGIGLQAFDYDVEKSQDLGTDRESLLLAHLGFGFYIGGPDAPRAEINNYYDHRHDDFVAGFNERAIGVPGHIGLSTTIYFTDHIGMHAVFEAGSSLLAGASLLIRQPAP